MGPYKLDYAVIILEKVPPVTEYAKLPDIGIADTLRGKSLTITGYGIAVWGNVNSIKITDPTYDNSGLPLPTNGAVEIVGDRQKSTGGQSVISISKYNSETAMTLARGDTLTCNGDSSTGLVIEPPSGAQRTLTSVVSQGDFNCRAVGTNTRVDTQEFYDYLKTIPTAKDPILLN